MEWKSLKPHADGLATDQLGSGQGDIHRVLVDTIFSTNDDEGCDESSA